VGGRLVAVALSGLVVLAGCGDGSEPAGDEASALELVSGAGRVEPPTDAPLAEVVAAANEFGLAFHREAAAMPENAVFGPASIVVAFGMARAGADESTGATIDTVFGFPPEPGVHEAINSLLRALDIDRPDTTLVMADGGWAQEGYEIRQSFLDVLATQYGVGLRTADLQGDAEASRAEINDWVAEHTRERIPELLPPRFINARTVYVVVNAIYLRALWEQPFGKYPTQPAPFTLADGSTVRAKTMHNAELQGRYLLEEGLAVAELPYQGGDLAMVVMVPDDLSALVERLDGQEWVRIAAGLQPGIVDLTMPRWEVESAVDLAGPLSGLGLHPIPGGNYPRIFSGVFLGQAAHGANITVDEQGTEAAAGTALGFQESGPPPPDAIVHADRPFLYLIVHRPTGLVLFTGQVVDPTA